MVIAAVPTTAITAAAVATYNVGRRQQEGRPSFARLAFSVGQQSSIADLPVRGRRRWILTLRYVHFFVLLLT